MLKEEFEFYKANQEDLVSKYEGKFLVIVGEEVVGAYESELEAYQDAKKKHKPGTFLIQECAPGEEAFTETFHSRVAF